MNTDQQRISSVKKQDLKKAETEKLFIDQLSEIITLEQNLYVTFQEITLHVKCIDMKLAMREQELEMANHLARLKEISVMVNFTKTKNKDKSVFFAFSSEFKAILNTHFQQPRILDLSLITFSKKVKSYEIACYHNLKFLASLLGKADVYQLLLENFDEQTETLVLLNELSLECYSNPIMYTDAPGSQK